MARTVEDNEHILDLIEDQMLRGVERPNQIKRLVNEALDVAASRIPRLGDKRTVQGLIDQVYGRWQRRNGDAETARKRLLAEAEEGVRAAYEVLRIAQGDDDWRDKAEQVNEKDDDGKRPRVAYLKPNINGQVGALRTIEKFQQRRARLLGLDKVTVDLGLSQEKLDDLRAKRLEEALAAAAGDPIREIYGASEDSRQVDGADHPVHPAAGAKEARTRQG